MVKGRILGNVFILGDGGGRGENSWYTDLEDFEAGEKSSLRGGVSQTSPLLEQGGLAGLTLAVGGEVACKLAGVLPEGGGSQGELGDLRLMEAGVEDMLTGEVEFQEWRDMLAGVTLPV